MEFKIISKMKHVWFQVPRVQCKGKCQDSCSNVPVAPVEAEYLQQEYRVTFPILEHGLEMGIPPAEFHTLGPNNTPCMFLKDGRCSIYRNRPLICRAYGHDIAFLRCGWGCDEGKFNNRRLGSLLLQLFQLSTTLPKYHNFITNMKENYQKSKQV